MAIDPLEPARMALADFGEDLTVTPAAGESFSARMLWGEGIDDATLGSSRSAMAHTLFRCAPETGELIAEGDEITTVDGKTFAVFEVIPRRGMLTEIRVVER